MKDHMIKDLGNGRIIEDFFLHKTQFDEMKQSFENGKVLYWPSQIVYADMFDVKCEDRYNFQMAHMFYDHTNPFYVSPSINVITPLLEALNIEVLIKVKANLNPCNADIIEHGYHTDLTGVQDGLKPLCRTAVFYINSNDGYTAFEDGQRVESVENRLLTFNAMDRHTGTTCTNSKYRIIININYIPYIKGV